MSNDFKPLQGMSDISGLEIQKWQKIEEHARKIFGTFGYSEFREPLCLKNPKFFCIH